MLGASLSLSELELLLEEDELDDDVGPGSSYIDRDRFGDSSIAEPESELLLDDDPEEEV